jgi:transcriptional regulator with XRE-family HTH domain
MLGQIETNARTRDHSPTLMASDRKVVSCKTCGLVQYCTRTGNCRRCLCLLPTLESLIPRAEPQELPGDECQLFEQLPNRKTVEDIGQRIQQLRETCRLTQQELQTRSRVSRSYLSRIEIGQLTPSLGTLEKISEALGIALNRFFLPLSNPTTVLDDPFILELRPFLRQLDKDQRQSIAKCIAAIAHHTSSQPPAIAQSRPAAMEAGTRVVIDCIASSQQQPPAV